MASQGFFIIDNRENISDGIIKSKSKETLGLAYQEEAPEGHYIVGKLKGYWIITEDEYKLLNKIKKDEKHTNRCDKN